MRPAVDRLVRYFETLTPERVAELPEYYAAGAYFKDPFNEVHRLQDIQAIFARMYEQVDAPRFKVRQSLAEGGEAFLVWDLEFRFRGRESQEVIHGVSHLRFGDEGKVISHRDYWDTGEELYQKLPFLGALFRWLRRRGG